MHYFMTVLEEVFEWGGLTGSIQNLRWKGSTAFMWLKVHQNGVNVIWRFQLKYQFI